MTVAVLVKVFDGVVLATDSAATLPLGDGSAQVWNNANKVFQLHRRKPVAAMTWGLGNIGSASIATLAKDLRRRLMGADPALAGWALPEDYTVEWVAARLVDLVFDETYVPEFVGRDAPEPLGFVVAGFSCDGKRAEAWLVEIENSLVRPAPRLLAGVDDSGWAVYAQPEAATRLFTGYDPALPQALAQVVPAEHREAVLTVLRAQERPAVASSMPFGDAVGFARYLVDLTVGYSRVTLGPDTVGGPVEVAGITRHEGFKWIDRKHYYHPDLNPEDPHRDYC